MPRAFLLAAGLDWETLVNSFWSWLDEAMQVLDGQPADDRVTRMLAAEDARIREFLAGHGRADQDKFVLAVALALLGTSYAATEKLAAELKERHVLEPRPKPAFDTYR
jgi:hypothetical protein